jgi:hypothetical protein
MQRPLPSRQPRILYTLADRALSPTKAAVAPVPLAAKLCSPIRRVTASVGFTVPPAELPQINRALARSSRSASILSRRPGSHRNRSDRNRLAVLDRLNADRAAPASNRA